MTFPGFRYRRETFSGDAEFDASLDVSSELSMQHRRNENPALRQSPSKLNTFPKSPATQHAQEYLLSKKQRPRPPRNNRRSFNSTTQSSPKDASDSTNCDASSGNACINTVSNVGHATNPTVLSSASLPVASKQATTTLVTVVLEVGLYPTGVPHVSAFTSAISTQGPNTVSVPSSTPIGTPTITATVPLSTPTRNAILFATTSPSDSQPTPSSSHSPSINLTEAAPILGGLIGGLLGLFLIGFIVSIFAGMRRRRREKEVLDMMAPSDLPQSFMTGPQNDPRLSSTWMGPLEYPNERRNSRLGF